MGSNATCHARRRLADDAAIERKVRRLAALTPRSSRSDEALQVSRMAALVNSEAEEVGQRGALAPRRG
jgi:hypothetical protein